MAQKIGLNIRRCEVAIGVLKTGSQLGMEVQPKARCALCLWKLTAKTSERWTVNCCEQNSSKYITK